LLANKLEAKYLVDKEDHLQNVSFKKEGLPHWALSLFIFSLRAE
jgi:hypothetical protein